MYAFFCALTLSFKPHISQRLLVRVINGTGAFMIQFSKPMIELVYQIRRFVPSDFKPSVKLANPELFDELRTYYLDGANAVTKALIKELFYLAGPEWTALLETAAQPAPKQNVKIYRGQTIFENKRAAIPLTEDQRKHMRKRVYRGQVIYD